MSGKWQVTGIRTSGGKVRFFPRYNRDVSTCLEIDFFQEVAREPDYDNPVFLVDGVDTSVYEIEYAPLLPVLAGDFFHFLFARVGTKMDKRLEKK